MLSSLVCFPKSTQEILWILNSFHFLGDSFGPESWKIQDLIKGIELPRTLVCVLDLQEPGPPLESTLVPKMPLDMQMSL